MMEHDGNQIRVVAWSEVFPWLRIARAFRPAISVRTLLFGAFGILLTVLGWGFIGGVFQSESASTRWLDPYVSCSWGTVSRCVPNRPAIIGEFDYGEPLPSAPEWGEVNPAYPWQALNQPALGGLTRSGFLDTPLRAVAAIILSGLWAAAVWAFFGAAICRAAAVQLAADEQVGLGAAMRFAGQKWPSYFFAPLMPVGGALLAALPVVILGLIIRAGGFGLFLGGLFWPLALGAGFVVTLLLLGTLFGWPLMWSAISAEGSDSFDALSRSYAYMFQRPLHYLFYALVAAFIGWLGWLLVREFAAGVIWATYWAAGWGCGSEMLDQIMNDWRKLEGVAYAGGLLIHFFVGCVKLLAVGYLFGYFWSASAAVYLLLRRNVDATEMDEVFLDADADEEPADLPAIGKDSVGAPVAEGDAGSPEAPEANGDPPQQ